MRAVATNTFRVAKNGAEFLKTCEAALGFPSRSLRARRRPALFIRGGPLPGSRCARRLVIDIGGGSTEFIIGTNYDAELLESVLWAVFGSAEISSPRRHHPIGL